MKKPFTIFLLFILIAGKSNAQTQFPFYGFELSNYEVGDTLEYYWNYYGGPPGWSQTYTSISIFHIINKESLSVDSIRYTLEDTYIENAQHSGYENYKDTLLRIITNDTIYNNNNNLLGEHLPPLDTSSGSLEYDTIAGLKFLSVNTTVPFGEIYYEAKENLGIMLIEKPWTGGPPFYTDSLLYAHLVHYGLYGNFVEIPLGVNNFSFKKAIASIRYNNNMNAWLNISSSQNLSNPILSIYDLLGQNIKSQPVNTGSNLIDMNALPKGMYLYKVESEGNILGQGKLMNMTN